MSTNNQTPAETITETQSMPRDIIVYNNHEYKRENAIELLSNLAETYSISIKERVIDFDKYYTEHIVTIFASDGLTSIKITTKHAELWWALRNIVACLQDISC